MSSYLLTVARYNCSLSYSMRYCVPFRSSLNYLWLLLFLYRKYVSILRRITLTNAKVRFIRSWWLMNTYLSVHRACISQYLITQRDCFFCMRAISSVVDIVTGKTVINVPPKSEPSTLPTDQHWHFYCFLSPTLQLKQQFSITIIDFCCILRSFILGSHWVILGRWIRGICRKLEMLSFLNVFFFRRTIVRV